MNIEQPLTEKTYRAINRYSSTDLRTYAENLKKFYKKCVLGQEEDEDEYSKAMKIGSIVHCLLLNPEEFDNKYFLSICEIVPSGNMLIFVESLYKHTVENCDESGICTMNFSDLCDLAYVDSGYKITKDAVLKKFIGSESERYYQQLREASSRGLEVVCMDDLAIANRIVEIAKTDTFVGNILNQEDTIDFSIFNEQKVEEFDLDGLKMKAMLDKTIANHIEKTIQLYDLKVVYDAPGFYYNYFLKRRADIQGYVYHKALLSGKLDLGFNYDDYEILSPIFVAIDSGCFYAPILYKMTIEDLENAWRGWQTPIGRKYIGISEIIDGIKWSEETGIWNRSKLDYFNNGFKQLI